MYLQSNKKVNCVGCKACAEICPKKCIAMVEDKDGFLYPVVDKRQCVNCKLCEAVCPKQVVDFADKNNEQVWVGVYKSAQTIYESSSGGAFTAIYEELLEQGYMVCGVKYDDTLKVIHDFAQTKKECEAFRKSKYVMSDTNGSFRKIADMLKEQKRVLFTGTPCQCAALKAFLSASHISLSNLVVVDLVCHGVPNQKIFDSYISELEERKGEKVHKYKFRNKEPEKGIANSRTAQIEFTSGKIEQENRQNDPYLRGYYSRLFYRPSCYVCEYARIERISDITIADAWGIEKVHSKWNPLEGVSMILANSDKGKTLIPFLKEKMTLYEMTTEWAEKNNEQLRKPTEEHLYRKRFFRYWKKKGFYNAVEKTTKITFMYRVLNKLRRLNILK